MIRKVLLQIQQILLNSKIQELVLFSHWSWDYFSKCAERYQQCCSSQLIINSKKDDSIIKGKYNSWNKSSPADKKFHLLKPAPHLPESPLWCMNPSSRCGLQELNVHFPPYEENKGPYHSLMSTSDQPLYGVFTFTVICAREPVMLWWQLKKPTWVCF